MSSTARYRCLRCLSVLLVGAGAGCSASGFRVYPAEKAPEGQSYLYYTLPRTVLVITVPLTRTTRAAGDCSLDRLAGELAATPSAPSAPAAPPPARAGAPGQKPKGGTEEAPAAAPAPAPPVAAPSAARQRALDMLKEAGIEPFDPKAAGDIAIGAITIAARSEPDPENVYAIALSPGFLASTAYTFEFSSKGVLGSASRRSESLLSTYTATAFSVVRGVAGAVPGFGGYAPSSGPCRRALSDLEDLRGSRRALVEGKANSQGLSKEALERMLSELAAIESDIVGRFAGRPSSIQGSVICEHTPGTTSAQPVDLFSISPGGVTGTPPGCLVPAELRDPSSASADVAIELTLDRVAAIADKARPPKGDAEEGGRGVYYRIPGQAFLTIARAPRGAGKNEAWDPIASARVDVAQFGRVVSLAGADDAGGAARNYVVKLDPVTGALLSYGPAALPEAAPKAPASEEATP